jgi:hypothetical protein
MLQKAIVTTVDYCSRYSTKSLALQRVSRQISRRHLPSTPMSNSFPGLPGAFEVH